MKTAAAIALTVVLVGSLLGITYWRLDRARRRAVARSRVADARARVGLPAPAADNVEGVNLAWQDECELILSMPTRCPDRQRLKEQLGSDPVLTAAFGLIADGINYDADLAAFAGELLDEIHNDQNGDPK